MRSPLRTPRSRGSSTKGCASRQTGVLLTLVASLACVFVQMSRNPVMQPDVLDVPWDPVVFRQTSAAAILPFDLSVNHLQVVRLAGGALPEQAAGAAEDFLPIVGAGSLPDLRFRLKGSVGASRTAMKDISAYQIQAEQAHSSTLIWDSGRIRVKSMPHSVEWGGEKLVAGTIVKWRVSVWDKLGDGPSTSKDWTKFGVGPLQWTGKWITHPQDEAKFPNTSQPVSPPVSPEECSRWEARKPLPVARAQIELSKTEQAKDIVSALLVVSGLGSFSASLDGLPLSSSSPLDPAMMDYTKRVSYRGYDVTSHFGDKKRSTHVVGVTLGSGWWDPRPLNKKIVKQQLLPHGPLTAIAQLHLMFDDGTTAVKISSGTQDWQVAKGFIRESDLFTGEHIDLGVLKDMRGWDSPEGFIRSGKSSFVTWVPPVLFKGDATREVLRKRLGYGNKRNYSNNEVFSYAEIGKLIPAEAPPVLPIERLVPESVVSLGDGRWLFDFGKAFSGVLRFDDGLPTPIQPKNGYPRAHSLDVENESFVTVVYGESLQMETGDINQVIVAGLGLHDGGIRQISRGPNYDTAKAGGPCYPRDHGTILGQRDAFIVPNKSSGSFADARQARFTSHGFRFAEVCCTAAPPTDVYALKYRTAFPEWGTFDSSNVLLNGAYELTRNALDSNMLGTQTDCPHREKLQYGGDLMADSPAAMHMFDLGAFYTKVIHDWVDTQWDNGAYTETSIWQELNDERGIGHGAGETVWASLPAVLTVRHMQQYGDLKLVKETFKHHVEWLEFLKAHWDAAMDQMFYNDFGNDLKEYHGRKGGLGDWLALRPRDTWLTHHAFYMASARSILYLGERLQTDKVAAAQSSALSVVEEITDKINSKFMKHDNFQVRWGTWLTPGPEMGLFARIVPGPKRCTVLKNLISFIKKNNDRSWPGDEEILFFRHLNKHDLKEMIEQGKVKLGSMNEAGERRISTLHKLTSGMTEGILAVRYSLRALSDMGFHHLALSKATGVGFPSFEYMLSHNATTMWESWWRSEDVYSRNHPMLGAVAEWLAASVAGVSLSPTTVAGEALLFWPHIPLSAGVVRYASATQGTRRGDASIAWEFLNLPVDEGSHNSTEAKVHIRALVPPGSTAMLKLPLHGAKRGGNVYVKYATKLPDLERARSNAASECEARRKAGKGFDYNWEYDREKKEWSKFHGGKAIGTPCKSSLFDLDLKQTEWSTSESVLSGEDKPRGVEIEIALDPGFYDIVMDKWRLMKEIEDKLIFENVTGDEYCSDSDTFSWDVNDATHII